MSPSQLLTAAVMQSSALSFHLNIDAVKESATLSTQGTWSLETNIIAEVHDLN